MNMEIKLNAVDVKAMSKLINPKSEQHGELRIIANMGDVYMFAGDGHKMGILALGVEVSTEQWAFAIPSHIVKQMPSKGFIETDYSSGVVSLKANGESYTFASKEEERTRRVCLQALRMIPDEINHSPGALVNPAIVCPFLDAQKVFKSKSPRNIEVYSSEPIGVVIIPEVRDRFIGVFGMLVLEKTIVIETFIKDISWNS